MVSIARIYLQIIIYLELKNVKRRDRVVFFLFSSKRTDLCSFVKSIFGWSTIHLPIRVPGCTLAPLKNKWVEDIQFPTYCTPISTHHPPAVPVVSVLFTLLELTMSVVCPLMGGEVHANLGKFGSIRYSLLHEVASCSPLSFTCLHYARI